MKCPKCHYLSFDPEPRCRNCGFTLGLEEPDFAMKPAESPANPPADLKLRSDTAELIPNNPMWAAAPLAAAMDAARTASEAPPAKPAIPAVTPPAASRTPRAPRKLAISAEATTPPIPGPAPVTTELPLFMKGMAAQAPDSEPQAVVAAAPPASAPVAAKVPVAPPVVVPEPPIVRPTPPRVEAEAPVRPRPAGSRRLGPLDRDLLEDLERLEEGEERQARDEERAARLRALPADRANTATRLGAAALDAALVGGLAVGMVALILRWCDLAWAQLSVLPVWPTVAFIGLVVLGYLLMFTAAGGQTIGKMLLGIRVVGAPTPDGREPLSFGQALLREVVALPSVLLVGAGFVPALLGDGRALHDRVAHTRVVRA